LSAVAKMHFRTSAEVLGETFEEPSGPASGTVRGGGD
jgi:hypothetical protein